MSTAPDVKWSVREARTRVPADLIATHDGLCGHGIHYRAGCPRCRWLGKDHNVAVRSTDSGRMAANDSMQKVRSRRRTRTTDAADADFARLHPSGLRVCAGCGELLPAGAFKRAWTSTDGRARRCDANGCRQRDYYLKQRAKLAVLWASRGLPTDQCGYCLAAPIEHIDHFHPSARGGADHPDNYVGACPGCNLNKSDRLPFEWLAATHPDRVDFFRALFPEETA